MSKAIRYLMMINFREKTSRIVLGLLLLLCSTALAGQIPQKQDPPVLVNDFASILTTPEHNELESKLVSFSDSTSNQIVLVTVKDFGGIDKAQFAYEIGEKWGVGQAKFDNGVVILIKPKVGNSRGEAFIAVGYGLEGIIPDAICKRIIENEMIPYFRNNDYYGGISAATKVIMALASKEYSSDEYAKKSNSSGNTTAIIVIIFIILFVIYCIVISKNNKNSNMGGGKRNISGLEYLLLNSALNGRNSGWSGGSSGGGLGGFGGFGGGSFGGGGAGGSW